MTDLTAGRPSDTPSPKVFLAQGELHCAQVPTVITTILGSCVSLCLWDAALRIGGMNHYVLPRSAGSEPSLRYGDVAIETLWAALEGLGSKRRHLRGKVFGGAAVLPVGGEDVTIGEKNTRLAMEWLRRHNIPVIAARTGGENGLLIRFNTADGGVSVRAVDPTSAGRLKRA
jgi:chemotaxis protein CheD